MNRHFSKEDRHMAKKHVKRCLASWVISQTHKEVPFLSCRDGYRHQKTGNNKCWRGCGEVGTLVPRRGDGNGTAAAENDPPEGSAKSHPVTQQCHL